MVNTPLQQKLVTFVIDRNHYNEISICQFGFYMARGVRIINGILY